MTHSAQLVAACSLGAAITLGCSCGGDDSGASTEGTFSVLTYNVHGLPAGVTGDDTTARTQLIAPLLAEFDVVGLQEDFIEDNHAILEAASPHSLRVRFADLYDPDRVYGSGLTSWSNFAEVDRVQVHYGSCNGVLDSSSDCLASKGFQAIRQQPALGVEIDFYNTHLEAGDSAQDDAVRADQVDMLLDSLASWSGGRAVVFTGDFNLHGEDAEDVPQLERLGAEGALWDSCVEVDCPEPARIDRIFFRSGVGVRLQAESWQQHMGFFDEAGVPLSDHDALWARFSWMAIPE